MTDDGRLHERTDRYGPRTGSVEQFLARLRALRAIDADRVRHAFVHRPEMTIDEVAVRHGEVISRVIRQAVKAGLREAHTAAEQAAFVALGVAGVADRGIGVYAADLAGALVVEHEIDPVDLDFLASPWDVLPRSSGGASVAEE